VVAIKHDRGRQRQSGIVVLQYFFQSYKWFMAVIFRVRSIQLPDIRHGTIPVCMRSS
jgi:hypothetical protein